MFRHVAFFFNVIEPNRRSAGKKSAYAGLSYVDQGIHFEKDPRFKIAKFKKLLLTNNDQGAIIQKLSSCICNLSWY